MKLEVMRPKTQNNMNFQPEYTITDKYMLIVCDWIGMEGRGRGGLINFPPLKRGGGLLERGGRNREFSLCSTDSALCRHDVLSCQDKYMLIVCDWIGMEGRGRGGLLTFLLLKGGGLLERGGRNREFSVCSTDSALCRHDMLSCQDVNNYLTCDSPL